MKSRDALTDLGWMREDADSSSFHRGLFRVLEAIVEDGEKLQDEVSLRSQMRHVAEAAAWDVAT